MAPPQKKKKPAVATQQAKLTPKADTRPYEVKIDLLKRLREIRALVAANNRCSIDNEAIVAQIFQESSFNAEAGKNKHQARGLMQVQPNAIRQVYAVRLKKKLGRTPTDVEKKKAFDDADVDYAKGVLFDEAKNIQIGTEYIQYWLDKSNGNIAKAYVGYRGPDEPTYYSRIKTTADKLRADPNSVKPLLEMKDLP